MGVGSGSLCGNSYPAPGLLCSLGQGAVTSLTLRLLFSPVGTKALGCADDFEITHAGCLAEWGLSRGLVPPIVRGRTPALIMSPEQFLSPLTALGQRPGPPPHGSREEPRFLYVRGGSSGKGDTTAGESVASTLFFESAPKHVAGQARGLL